MKVLGFDTSTDDTVAAAIEGDLLRFERSSPPVDRRPVHSRLLLAMVAVGVGKLGGWGQVERIAVGVGPGTFTGIRIGIATAAGLSASTGVPVVGISTLSALARSIGDASEAKTVMPLVDARRGEVFGALHRPDGESMEDPFVCAPEQLVTRLEAASQEGATPLVAGPGALRFRDELLSAGFEVEPAESPVHRLSGSSFCELGASATEIGPKTLEPLYLRKPDAQLWLERDGKNQPPS